MPLFTRKLPVPKLPVCVCTKNRGGGPSERDAAFQIACQTDHCCRALAFADRCADLTTCAMRSRASGWSLPYVLYWFLDRVYSGHQPFEYPYFLSHCVTVVPPVLGTCTNQRTPQRIVDAGERTRPEHVPSAEACILPNYGVRRIGGFGGDLFLLAKPLKKN